MKEIALVTSLLAAGYVATFLGLNFVAAREAGRSIRLFDPKNPLQSLAGAVFKFAIIGAAIWPLLRAFEGVGGPADFLTATLQGWPAAIGGHFLVAVGAGWAVMSQMHLSASGGNGAAGEEVDRLVQDGPYGLSRNPVFVGQVVFFVGLLLAFADFIQLTLSLLAIAAIRLHIHIEEGALRAQFGNDFDDYASRVPRWLGRVQSRREVQGQVADGNREPSSQSYRRSAE